MKYVAFQLRNPVFLLVFITIVAACHSVERKGKQLAEKAKQTATEVRDTVSKRVDKWVDKRFPAFDAYQPDTEHNKSRFSAYLKVPVTNDVKNIYAYGDFFGADYKVLIAFSCNANTIKNIVEAKKLHLEKELQEGLIFSEGFTWWDETITQRVYPYKAGEEYAWWNYLWYDAATGKAYYLEYSM